ncbi:MAG: type I polyketide synthase, partial [Pseudomonadota bacterium]
MSDAYTSDTFDTDIAVVGMAGRFPGARTISQYWDNLRNGVESLTTFTDEELLAAGVSPAMLDNPNYVKRGAVLPDMEMFDAPFFGFSPREASIMDPQHRHFLECAWEALEDAGHVPSRFPGAIGVFGGSGHNAYMPYNLLTNPKLMQAVGFFLVRHTGNDKDFLTTRVSYLLNLKGPSVNVQTACSTSLVAIHTGVQSLLNRECDMALAGGVTIELPHRHGYLYHEGEILSPDGHCHAFDADSKGTVFGSAVGVVVLRRLADAIQDGDHIHAVIKGSAINNDGSGKMGYLAPSVDGQAQAIAEALALANVSPETISYIETHGTGTPVGDPIEIAALSQAFRQGTDARGFCGIGSVKSNIGHTDTAAGVASFIKVALAMQHRELPASLHFKSPNPACEFERSPFYVNAALKPWTPPVGQPRRAGVSSLGVGGTNAHIVLEEAPARAPSGLAREHQVLLLSARTASALDANTAALSAHLARHPEVSLADAAYTLEVGREAMTHRRVLVSSSPAEAAQALANPDPKRVFTETAPDGGRTVAFMFAGGGAQYPTMGAGLYASEPVFRQAVDECLALLARHEKADFKSLLFPAAGQEKLAAQTLERPSMALPCLLTVQYAQAKLWMSWGLQPGAMIGHSMGEYTAAHLAGVFSLEDALRLVALRGRLFETLPEGGMLSVPLPEAELKALMGPDLSIAALNGPQLSVASGPVAAIDALQQKLAAQEIDAARVRISVAAHSLMLEPILKEFGAFFQRIAMKAPTLPLISNVTGTWMTAEQATDPQYWVNHLRHTVRFAEGLQALLADQNTVLLEVGPGRTLASLARQHPARAPDQPVFNSLRHPDEQVADQAFVLGVLGRLWGVGAPVDWAQVRGAEKRLRVPLPTYQFDHQRHWVEPGQSLTLAAEPTLDKRADLAQWFYQPVWQQRDLPRPVAEPVGEANAEVPLARSVWVLADGSALCARLIQRLRSDGAHVTVVRTGKAYLRKGDEFTLQPAQAAQWDKLLGTVSVEGHAPQDLYHFWTLTGTQPLDAGPRGIEEMRRLGFDSLLNLAQAVGREDLSEPMRWCVVTDHLQRVAGETLLQPAKATLLGPCKVIPREFPHIRCHSIDLL